MLGYIQNRILEILELRQWCRGDYTTGLESGKSNFHRKTVNMKVLELEEVWPISVTSFILQTLGRLVGRDFRGNVLLNKLLHANQHSYRAG